MAPERQPVQVQDQIEVDGTLTDRVFVSAHTGAGIAQLRARLALLAQRNDVVGASDDNSHLAAEAVVQLGTIDK